jgi:uncharacterized protein YbaA (DUF1428 family)
MKYVDGFVIAVPKKNVAAYKKMSTKAGKVWMEYGALAYVEAVGDDVNSKFGLPFPKLAKLKKGEIVLFSYIVFKSRAHRDRVNAKVIKDPRLDMNPKKMPFDIKRMSYGGFTSIVDM